jgi:hypothetical protein
MRRAGKEVKKTCLAIAILAALAPAAAAHAAHDPLGGGTTKLILDKRFARFLHHNEIKLLPLRGAKRKGRAYLLGISGGRMDPTTGKGEVDNEGVLLFAGAGKRVLLRNVTVKAKRTPLVAKVGGGQLKVARAQGVASKREGFGTRFVAKQLRLTAKFAARLNKKLGPKVTFAPNQLLGTLSSSAQPRLVAIEGTGAAAIDLDPGFLAKLDSRFVSLNPIAPAQRFGTRATFPIAVGGMIAPNGSEGTLRTGGALEFLQLGAGQVSWSELWFDLAARINTAEVDIEPTPAFPGKVGRVDVLDLGAASLAADPGARTISLAGAPLTLSVQAAAGFNQAFAQGDAPAFTAGEAVGTLGFTAQGH